MSQQDAVDKKLCDLLCCFVRQGFCFGVTGEVVSCYDYPSIARSLCRKGTEKVHSNLLERLCWGWYGVQQPGWPGLWPLSTLHSRQVFTYRATSVGSRGQWNFSWIRRRVRAYPRCPAVGSSWEACRISSRRLLGTTIRYVVLLSVKFFFYDDAVLKTGG